MLSSGPATSKMQNADLAPSEYIAYQALCEAAERGARCPTADDLREILGFSSVSGTVSVIQRLEKRGLVSVQRFQRGRVVRILATGKETACHMNTAPHWRDRPRDMASPSKTNMAEKHPSVMEEVKKWAKERNLSLGDALADLAYIGFKTIKAGKETNAKSN